MLTLLYLVLVAGFIALARRGRHGWAIVVLVAVVLLTAAGALAGLLTGALSCDENCDGTEGTWTDRADAWQWALVMWLPVAAWVATLFALGFAGARRSGRAIAAVLVAVALDVAWLPFMAKGAGTGLI